MKKGSKCSLLRQGQAPLFLLFTDICYFVLYDTLSCVFYVCILFFNCVLAKTHHSKYDIWDDFRFSIRLKSQA